MRLVYKSLLVFIIPFFRVGGSYEGHTQVCRGLTALDIRWVLNLNEHNSYSLRTTELKNEYLSKPKETFISGIWEIKDDTLKLYEWGKKGNALTFSVKGDTLIFQNNNPILPRKDLAYLGCLYNKK
jgi:hypothetical protein